MKQKSANDHFGNSNGTSQYYRHPLSSIVYTDGVRDLAETCEAYWLIDLIVSHQAAWTLPPFGGIEGGLHPFQVWELRQVEGFQYEAECTDGNGKHITRQRIPYTDFPYQEARIWLSERVLLLPCEY